MAVRDDRLDAYLLIDHVEPGKPIRQVLDDIFDHNPGTVRFVARFAGPYVGFVAYQTDGLAQVHDLTSDAFWVDGARCETLIVVKPSRAAIPKRRSPDHCAMVRAASDEPDGLLDRLDDRFGPRLEEQLGLPEEYQTFGYGAAVVNGAFDLLIEVGSPTLEGTKDLVREVRSIPGMGRTSTAFAFLPGNARKRSL
ncbi:MAG: hypothetical protein U0V56_05665 [Actinomycetota bacterium]